MRFNNIHIKLFIGILCLGLLVGGYDAKAGSEKEAQMLQPTGDTSFTRLEVNRLTELLDLEVSIKQKSSLVLRILDETGKEIYHSATEVNRPTYRTRVDIASFPKGKYKIVLYTNDGRYIRNFQK